MSVESGSTRRYEFETITVPNSVTNGNTYEIRAQINGVSIESPVACTKDIVIDTNVTVQPTFAVRKSSGVVCTTGGGFTIDYTVTVTNTSTVAGTLDFIQDQLPPEVTSASQVQNVNPAATTVTADMITWNGPISFTAGETKTYTYSLVFSTAQTANFTSNVANNTVTIQYDTETSQNNTITFDLATLINCLPDTGLFDSPSGFILAGLALILAGILVNRSGILLNFFGARAEGRDATAGIVKSLLDPNAGAEEAFQNKVVASREKKFGGKRK
jgi:uncharacterized repeat protein (TIGR01451 family)